MSEPMINLSVLFRRAESKTMPMILIGDMGFTVYENTLRERDGTIVDHHMSLSPCVIRNWWLLPREMLQ